MYRFFNLKLVLKVLGECFTSSIVEDNVHWYKNSQNKVVYFALGLEENLESHLWFLCSKGKVLTIDFKTADAEDIANFFNFVNTHK